MAYRYFQIPDEIEGSSGYVNVYLIGLGGPFCRMKLPEIVDFGVLEKYRRKGIGSKLMDVAEQIAGQYADTVWLGVGLHSGYGSAQRMYVKRGYIPDGSGIWYQDRQCRPYEAGIANDDELVLYLSKRTAKLINSGLSGSGAGWRTAYSVILTKGKFNRRLSL